MNQEQHWEKAKYNKKERVQCPHCLPYHATYDDIQQAVKTYPKVEKHELNDCFIYVCINHSIVWRQMKEE